MFSSPCPEQEQPGTEQHRRNKQPKHVLGKLALEMVWESPETAPKNSTRNGSGEPKMVCKQPRNGSRQRLERCNQTGSGQGRGSGQNFLVKTFGLNCLGPNPYTQNQSRSGLESPRTGRKSPDVAWKSPTTPGTKLVIIEQFLETKLSLKTFVQNLLGPKPCTISIHPKTKQEPP